MLLTRKLYFPKFMKGLVISLYTSSKNTYVVISVRKVAPEKNWVRVWVRVRVTSGCK